MIMKRTKSWCQGGGDPVVRGRGGDPVRVLGPPPPPAQGRRLAIRGTGPRPRRQDLALASRPGTHARGQRRGPGSWCRRASAFALRTLHLFDWCDDSALSLKRLLLRSMFCPPMVRTKQGRKMLAAAFALDPAFTSELEAVIRNQLLSGRKSLADHYGEILHTAWRSLSSSKKKKKTGEEEVDAAGSGPRVECLLALEDGVFPALVASCLGARTQRLAEMLRRTLRAAMYDRRSRCVATETLICETHEPLVFRSLCSPNAQVRANAIRLLSECFPLVRRGKERLAGGVEEAGRGPAQEAGGRHGPWSPGPRAGVQGGGPAVPVRGPRTALAPDASAGRQGDGERGARLVPGRLRRRREGRRRALSGLAGGLHRRPRRLCQGPAQGPARGGHGLLPEGQASRA